MWASVSVHPGYRCWLSINACVFNVNAKCVIESIRAITIPLGAPKDKNGVSAFVGVSALALCEPSLQFVLIRTAKIRDAENTRKTHATDPPLRSDDNTKVIAPRVTDLNARGSASW